MTQNQLQNSPISFELQIEIKYFKLKISISTKAISLVLFGVKALSAITQFIQMNPEFF